MARCRLALCAVLCVWSASGAVAQGSFTPPLCTAAIEGAVTELAGKMCLCRFQPGGVLTGRPPGHRWDCGVLRPSCGVTPPDLGENHTLPLSSYLFVQPELRPWKPGEPRPRRLEAR
jgi:hypothetical protein